MNDCLVKVLEAIEEEYKETIEKGARHYLEVNIGRRAAMMGYDEIKEKYRHTHAIVPLKAPRSGMKVRIDGRTFAHYAEYASGVAVPAYCADEAGRAYRTFMPQDSMVCNFC